VTHSLNDLNPKRKEERNDYKDIRINSSGHQLDCIYNIQHSKLFKGLRDLYLGMEVNELRELRDWINQGRNKIDELKGYKNEFYRACMEHCIRMGTDYEKIYSARNHTLRAAFLKGSAKKAHRIMSSHLGIIISISLKKE